MTEIRHTFIAADPEPKPQGYMRWKDYERRATCSCGWKADTNSVDASAAAAVWRIHKADTATPDRAELARAAVYALRSDIGDMGDALVDLDPTWEQAVEILHHLRLARQTLATAESVIEGHAARLMRDAGLRDPQEVDGVGQVQVRKGSNRKAWQHNELAKQVIDTHMTGTDGELPTPWEVRDWLLAALAPSYWRTGVLKDLGIDPGDYCETTPGRHTVQITTNDKPFSEPA